MKQLLVGVFAFIFVAISLVTSCNSSENELEEAKADVMAVKVNLEEPNEEYLTDIENYKKKTADKIEANNKSIADFKARIALKKTKAKYKKRVTDLEQKNSDMNKKMEDYKVEGKDSWEKFKIEFSHDMDQMEQAFKALRVKNIK